MNLNLDECKNEEEGTPLKEELNSGSCPLCENTNYNYLLSMQNAMMDCSSSKNMYSLMWKSFERRMQLLKQQDLKVVEMTKDEFIEHFEHHLVSFDRICIRDLRLISRMQNILLDKIRSKTGLDEKTLSSWIRLSNHKMNLALKYKKRSRKMTKIKPYEFS